MNTDRRHRFLFTLLSLGFIAVAAGFFIAGEHATGWDGLSYFIYGMAAVVLWALVSMIYLIWVVIRDGWRKPNIPALAGIAIILGAALFLGLSMS